MKVDKAIISNLDKILSMGIVVEPPIFGAEGARPNPGTRFLRRFDLDPKAMTALRIEKPELAGLDFKLPAGPITRDRVLQIIKEAKDDDAKKLFLIFNLSKIYGLLIHNNGGPLIKSENLSTLFMFKLLKESQLKPGERINEAEFIAVVVYNIVLALHKINQELKTTHEEVKTKKLSAHKKLLTSITADLADSLQNVAAVGNRSYAPITDLNDRLVKLSLEIPSLKPEVVEVMKLIKPKSGLDLELGDSPDRDNLLLQLERFVSSAEGPRATVSTNTIQTELARLKKAMLAETTNKAWDDPLSFIQEATVNKKTLIIGEMKVSTYLEKSSDEELAKLKACFKLLAQTQFKTWILPVGILPDLFFPIFHYWNIGKPSGQERVGGIEFSRQMNEFLMDAKSQLNLYEYLGLTPAASSKILDEEGRTNLRLAVEFAHFFKQLVKEYSLKIRTPKNIDELLVDLDSDTKSIYFDEDLLDQEEIAPGLLEKVLEAIPRTASDSYELNISTVLEQDIFDRIEFMGLRERALKKKGLAHTLYESDALPHLIKETIRNSERILPKDKLIAVPIKANPAMMELLAAEGSISAKNRNEWLPDAHLFIYSGDRDDDNENEEENPDPVDSDSLVPDLVGSA